MSSPSLAYLERLAAETPRPQSRRNTTVVGLSLPDTDTQAAATRSGTPSRLSFLNDLRRLTSIRQAVVQNQFLESLPRATKIFVLASVLDAIFIMALSIEQLVVGGDVLHVLLAMLVTSVFFFWFVVSAIVHENAYELLITVVLSAIIAVRTMYYVATRKRSPGEIAAAVLAILLTATCSLLALVSYRQFGWRQHSRLACDLRIKNAGGRQRSRILVKRFLALIKLDLQFLIIMFLLGINVATDIKRQPNNNPLVITNTCGFVLNLAWVALAYWTVLHEHCHAAGALLAFLVPCLGMPIIDIVLSFVRVAPTAPKTRETMVLSAVTFAVVRLVGTVVVLQCVQQFGRLRREVGRLEKQDPGTPISMDDIPPELMPLVQGAWIGKPSPGAPKKRRFFQLSSDGSTLRWAWDKYIVLYYVEDQANDDEEWEIRLRLMSAQDQPDLLLRFQDLHQYLIWKRGLALTLTLLFSPSGLAPGTHAPDPNNAGRAPVSKSRAEIVQQLMEATADSARVSPRRLMRQLSGQISRRASTSDPENTHFQRLAAAVPALQSPLRSPTQAPPPAPRVPPGVAPIPMLQLDGVLGSEQELARRSSLHRSSRSISATVPSLRAALKREQSVCKDPSPQAEPEGTGLRRTSSLPSANVREIVFEQVSPRGLHVRMRITGSSPRSAVDDTPFVLGPPPPPRHPKLAAAQQQAQAKPAQSSVRSVTEGAKGNADGAAEVQKEGVRKAGPAVQISVGAGRPAPAASTPQEEVDAREYLDKLGPLRRAEKRSEVPDVSTPQHAGSSSLIEVVVARPGPHEIEQRPDTTPKALSDTSSTAETVHRRTQTSSSQESFGDGVIFSRRHGYNSSGECTAGTSGSGSEWGQLTSQPPASSSLTSSFPVTLKVSIEIIDYEDLSFGKFLGQGAEGEVYAAWYMDTPVAVKQTNSVAEVEMNLHAGSHDNIVALRGLCQHNGKLFLVMEYCPRGTLDLLLHHSPVKKWDPAPLLRLVRSIARGMLHLHTRKPPILHRDLKPANVFVGHGLIMKIGDFGMSRHVLDHAPMEGVRASLEKTLTAGTIGTAAYCAPELLDATSPVSAQTAQQVLKSDVYSFGVLLWQILTRRRPYEGMDGFQIQTRWYMGDDMTLPPVPVPAEGPGLAIMAALATLVTECTQLDPTRRPSFKGILERLRPLGGAFGTAVSGPI